MLFFKSSSFLSKILVLVNAYGKWSRNLLLISSQWPADPCFVNASDEEAYNHYKAIWITPSKILNLEVLNFQVLTLFTCTTLSFILTLSYPFYFKLLLEFFVSLRIHSEGTSLHSYVNRRPLEITYQHFDQFLHLCTSGEKIHLLASNPHYDWTLENNTLKE